VTDPNAKLAKSPIVEAVIDIDCDMPTNLDFATLLARTTSRLGPEYPKPETLTLDNLRMTYAADATVDHTLERRVEALRMISADGSQLVQVRSGGFSFNRLAPYTTLDDYFEEIERAWRIFVEVAEPIQVRAVRLRYINRVLLPFDGAFDLNEYLTSRLEAAKETNLTFVGFLHQYSAIEQGTGNLATTLLTAQLPEAGSLPLIFDIQVTRERHVDVADWRGIRDGIQSLRSLKNRIFAHTLTDKCRRLFQP